MSKSLLPWCRSDWCCFLPLAEPPFLISPKCLQPHHRDSIFKLLRSPGIDSASLCSLAGRYDNPITTRFLAPIDCSKIPALHEDLWCRGSCNNDCPTQSRNLSEVCTDCTTAGTIWLPRVYLICVWKQQLLVGNKPLQYYICSLTVRMYTRTCIHHHNIGFLLPS